MYINGFMKNFNAMYVKATETGKWEVLFLNSILFLIRKRLRYTSYNYLQCTTQYWIDLIYLRSPNNKIQKYQEPFRNLCKNCNIFLHFIPKPWINLQNFDSKHLILILFKLGYDWYNVTDFKLFWIPLVRTT